MVTMSAPQAILLPTGNFLGASTVVRGVATDDGFPTPLVYRWAGPPTVSFASPLTPETVANFTDVGVFQLTLTVSDGLNSIVGTTTVTVRRDPGGPPLDTIVPVITSVTPTSAKLTATSGSLLFSVNVTDNIGVVWVSLSIDGLEVAHSNASKNKMGPIVRLAWNELDITAGVHQVTVRAFDGNRNMAAKAFAFTVTR